MGVGNPRLAAFVRCRPAPSAFLAVREVAGAHASRCSRQLPSADVARPLRDSIIEGGGLSSNVEHFAMAVASEE